MSSSAIMKVAMLLFAAFGNATQLTDGASKQSENSLMRSRDEEAPHAKHIQADGLALRTAAAENEELYAEFSRMIGVHDLATYFPDFESHKDHVRVNDLQKAVEEMRAMHQAKNESMVLMQKSTAGCDSSATAVNTCEDCGHNEWCWGESCSYANKHSHRHDEWGHRSCTNHDAYWCAQWITHHCHWNRIFHAHTRPCEWIIDSFVKDKCTEEGGGGYDWLLEKTEPASKASPSEVEKPIAPTEKNAALDESLSGKRSC